LYESHKGRPQGRPLSFSAWENAINSPVRFFAALLILAGFSGPAMAWGGKGHRMIGVLAAQKFPATVPAFLRSPEAVFEIGEMAREPDRSRGAGQPHDGDRDPAHFVDISDDGTILEGPKLSALPATRLEFDTALRAIGTTQYKAGWLPYTLMDGWQQLVQDFAIWRTDVAGIKFAKTKAERAWFQRDRHVRELLTLRDLGTWAHFVGDGSQPMHASVHYNGWGDFPNPENFNSVDDFHSRFETVFVNANIQEQDVKALLKPYSDCACTIQTHVAAYLAATQAGTATAYRFDQAKAFDNATPEAKLFVATRLAAGADMLRDLVVDAWKASTDTQLGYKPRYTVKDIEAGKVDLYPLLHN
jgi:hypothetical protein